MAAAPQSAVTQMSQRKFSPEVRLAVWQAYGSKCYLCTKPITLSELRLDHVVPELIDDDKWAPLRELLGLPDTYDLNSLENIAASCDKCNNEKSNELPSAGFLGFLLCRTAKRAARVRMLLAEHRRKSREDLAKFYLAQARRYDVTARDLQEAAMKAHSGSKYPLNDAYLEQILSVSVDELENVSLQALDERPLFEPGVTVPLINQHNEIREVSSVAEYRAAHEHGFEPMGTRSIKAVTGIIRPLAAVLALLKVAKVPEHSLLSHPRVSVHSLEQIPARLLDACPVEERSHPIFEDESIQSLVTSGRASISNCAADFIDVEHEHFNYRLIELMRADFDGDGSEEMLVNVHVDALGGSMGYTALYLFSREDGNPLLKTREYDPLAGAI